MSPSQKEGDLNDDQLDEKVQTDQQRHPCPPAGELLFSKSCHSQHAHAQRDQDAAKWGQYLPSSRAREQQVAEHASDLTEIAKQRETGSNHGCPTRRDKSPSDDSDGSAHERDIRKAPEQEGHRMDRTGGG
jgi:hypothetical protein